MKVWMAYRVKPVPSCWNQIKDKNTGLGGQNTLVKCGTMSLRWLDGEVGLLKKKVGKGRPWRCDSELGGEGRKPTKGTWRQDPMRGANLFTGRVGLKKKRKALGGSTGRRGYLTNKGGKEGEEEKLGRGRGNSCFRGGRGGRERFSLGQVHDKKRALSK